METDTLKAFKTPADTVSILKRQSPKKAALLSTAFPGLGQIYNKKYWKLPIVYGGLAGLGTWVGFNTKNLRGYTNAYKLQLDDDPNTIGSYKGLSDVSRLKIKRDEVKRNLDLSIILTSVFYALNIVDATVDAHLFDYSITEDISVRVEPEWSFYEAQYIPQAKVGLNFSFYFK